MKSDISFLYIHIPFCKDRCIYCDFYSERIGLFKEYIDLYIESLKKEFYHYKKYLGKIKTIYIGGGTPSLLPYNNIQSLLSLIRDELILEGDYEFTFEMNPESVDIPLLNMLKDYGVNRISLGIQSLNDGTLKKLNRVHDRKTALSAIEEVFLCGFGNVSVDFLIGTTKNFRVFLNEIENFLRQFHIHHLSAYILTLNKIDRKPIPEIFSSIKEETIVRQYESIDSILRSFGFKHYEISNFAIDGYESRHNLNYWKNGYYIGLGASAAGHYKDENEQIIRYKNVPNLKKYIRGIDEDKPEFSELEHIDSLTDINEKMMLGIRTIYGFSLNELKERLTEEQFNILIEKIDRFISEGLLQNHNGLITPSIPEGYIMNNLIARELMF